MANHKKYQSWRGEKTKNKFDENTRQLARRQKTIEDEFKVINEVAELDIRNHLKKHNALKKLGLITCLVYASLYFDLIWVFTFTIS